MTLNFAKKKVCVVTGTRAEFGLLQWVIDLISKSEVLELQIIVTGMHLSPEFGLTVQDIDDSGVHIDYKVEMLLSSDTSVGVTKSMGLGQIGFADAFSHLQPDLLLVLGDRFEIFSAVSAAMVFRIPVAHLHGGESTEGLIDESIRHSITKMSHIHFVAAEQYRNRVIQLGEEPSRVYQVGGLGIDNIKRLKLLSREELQASLNFTFQEHNFLITFHPVTLESATASLQIDQLLASLKHYTKAGLIFTLPNADTDGRVVIDKIIQYCSENPNSHYYTSLGQLKYLSAVSHVDAVIGNSSSGLLEVPSFKKATINIGDRQRGRLKASSVIDCEPTQDSILGALQLALSRPFQRNLVHTENPYGNGGASSSIVKILEDLNFSNLLKKRFYDIHLP